MLSNPYNSFVIALMLSFAALVVLLSGFLEFPSASPSIPSFSRIPSNVVTGDDSFTDLLAAFKLWSSEVGCSQFRSKHEVSASSSSRALQDVDRELNCSLLKKKHVGILVKGWTWLPDNLDNLYSCRCGLTCLWTKSPVLSDSPDALLFETTTPPFTRRRGDPIRIYMDLEPGRKRSGLEDIFVSYHRDDDVQSTYAGALFHNSRNHRVSSSKNNETLIYWSSSRCLPDRDRLAGEFLGLVPHHSFGKCLNNVGGPDAALSLYPECSAGTGPPQWWDHLHCAMSHYKFVLAIENTATHGYVTEKLFYALDAGSVPVYFGAPDVSSFAPPHSFIDGTRFRSLRDLAAHVKQLARDPVAYAEYHAWRRCGVLGNYGKARAASLDTLPCRLCEAVSRRAGTHHRSS